MKKNIIKFLRNSFITMVGVSVVVFIGLAMIMTWKTRDSIKDVGSIYMEELNLQLQQKFSTVINIRVIQLDGIIQRTESITDREQCMEQLRRNLETTDFISLGFYSEDTGLTIFGGEPVELLGTKDFAQSLEQDGKMVAQGLVKGDEKVLILGEKGVYQMADGTQSQALVAVLPMDYLKEALFLDEEEGMVYTHIIDQKGEFVIRSGDAFRNSYFDRVRSEVKHSDRDKADESMKDFQEAMKKGESYSTVFDMVNGETRQIYCSQLMESPSWYLVSVMPSGALNHSIARLDTVRIGIMISSGTIILVVMMIIFVLYYRMTRRQMEALEQAREEAINADKAKSEFLSSMSHDIRTPMNAIVGMTEIAIRNIKDPARVEDCLHKVKLSSKHLLGLINDVLDMSKIESGKMSLNLAPVSLRDVMDDIVNIMRPQVSARDQYFDIFIQKIQVEEICCDSVRLNQVLLNLLSNAVKFTPEEGRIDVHVYQEDSPQGEEYVRTHFIVQDTGIGMSEEFQQKIWDTFSREETEKVQHITGTGLGMAITKSIVALMGGTIELESHPGQGSKFQVTVDFKKADVTEEEMKLPPWRILVVDDNELLCSSAAANLEELGAHAEWTLDGREAVQMVKKRWEQGEDYQFVLIDWKMPGMDGLETVQEIRKNVSSDIPVFLISAYDWSDIENEVNETVEGFIAKPLFKSTLYASLSQYIDGNEGNAEHKDSTGTDFSGKHILLAEDIDLNWEVAQTILSMSGLDLVRAVNGQECVEKFKASALGYYDAILMDIRMPVMNGYDATLAIRALERADKDLPIIAMTADAFSDDARRCLECGMNAHIAKPIDLNECNRILSEYLK